jgi:hypothetical protein
MKVHLYTNLEGLLANDLTEVTAYPKSCAPSDYVYHIEVPCQFYRNEGDPYFLLRFSKNSQEPYAYKVRVVE